MLHFKGKELERLKLQSFILEYSGGHCNFLNKAGSKFFILFSFCKIVGVSQTRRATLLFFVILALFYKLVVVSKRHINVM